MLQRFQREREHDLRERLRQLSTVDRLSILMQPVLNSAAETTPVQQLI
jgi:hypothetical protein